MAELISVTINPAAWDSALAKLGRDVGTAAMRAINSTATSAKAAIVPVVAQDMNSTESATDRKVRIREATPSTLSAMLYASRGRVPLIAFRATGPNPSRGRGNGVTVTMPALGGSSGLVTRTAVNFPHAFLARVPFKGGRHLGVFERRLGANRRGPKPNRSQLPIWQRYGPAVSAFFEARLPIAVARATAVLPGNFAQEVQALIAQSA